MNREIFFIAASLAFVWIFFELRGLKDAQNKLRKIREEIEELLKENENDC